MDVLTLRVRQFFNATPHARILRLDLGGAPFRYKAGQWARLGAHGQAVRKPYSIASAPAETSRDGSLEFLVRIDAAGHAAGHLGGLRRGARVDLEGPFGAFHFPERPEERRFLFIAGGAGIAPLRSMIHHVLLSERAGHLGLLYSARSPLDFAYGSEMRRLARAGRIDLTLTVTREAGGSWRGERGRIGLDRFQALQVDAATLCFLCGPPALIEDVPPLLRHLGVPASRIRMEEF